MADAYLVTVPSVTGGTQVNKVRNVAVFADDADDAKAMAKAAVGGDSTGIWDQATATAIAAAADMSSWRCRVTVSDPSDGAVVADVTVTAAASDAIDDIGGDLATALNATASIANASYDTMTQTLVIAEGASDALGDHAVTVEMFPPSANIAEDVAVPGFVGTITDEGMSSADLSVVLAADAYTVPGAPIAIVGT